MNNNENKEFADNTLYFQLKVVESNPKTNEEYEILFNDEKSELLNDYLSKIKSEILKFDKLSPSLLNFSIHIDYDYMKQRYSIDQDYTPDEYNAEINVELIKVIYNNLEYNDPYEIREFIKNNDVPLNTVHKLNEFDIKVPFFNFVFIDFHKLNTTLGSVEAEQIDNNKMNEDLSKFFEEIKFKQKGVNLILNISPATTFLESLENALHDCNIDYNNIFLYLRFPRKIYVDHNVKGEFFENYNFIRLSDDLEIGGLKIIEPIYQESKILLKKCNIAEYERANFICIEQLVIYNSANGPPAPILPFSFIKAPLLKEEEVNYLEQFIKQIIGLH